MREISLLTFKTYNYRNQDCGIGGGVDTDQWNRIQNQEIDQPHMPKRFLSKVQNQFN